MQFPLSRREVSSYALMASLVVALLLGGYALLQFALPAVAYTDLGPLADYPPADEPYTVQHGTQHIYLVNDGTRLLALDPLYPVQGGHLIRWMAARNAFFDPGRGTWFTPQGINTVSFAADDRPMARYRLKLEDGILWIADEPDNEQLWELVLP